MLRDRDSGADRCVSVESERVDHEPSYASFFLQATLVLALVIGR